MLRSDRKTRNPREESTVTRTQERITGYGWRATLFPHHVKNRSSLRVVVKMRWMGNYCVLFQTRDQCTTKVPKIFISRRRRSPCR